MKLQKSSPRRDIRPSARTVAASFDHAADVGGRCAGPGAGRGPQEEAASEARCRSAEATGRRTAEACRAAGAPTGRCATAAPTCCATAASTGSCATAAPTCCATSRPRPAAAPPVAPKPDCRAARPRRKPASCCAGTGRCSCSAARCKTRADRCARGSTGRCRPPAAAAPAAPPPGSQQRWDGRRPVAPADHAVHKLRVRRQPQRLRRVLRRLLPPLSPRRQRGRSCNQASRCRWQSQSCCRRPAAAARGPGGRPAPGAAAAPAAAGNRSSRDTRQRASRG